MWLRTAPASRRRCRRRLCTARRRQPRRRYLRSPRDVVAGGGLRHIVVAKWCATADASPTPMSDQTTKPRIKPTLKTERPKLHKVILLNDDFTPREFVVTVLKAEFHVGEDLAQKIMITAHRRGVCVVAVFTKDVAETKATRATDAGRAKGYPLLFTTEPEE